MKDIIDRHFKSKENDCTLMKSSWIYRKSNLLLFWVWFYFTCCSREQERWSDWPPTGNNIISSTTQIFILSKIWALNWTNITLIFLLVRPCSHMSVMPAMMTPSSWHKDAQNSKKKTPLGKKIKTQTVPRGSDSVLPCADPRDVLAVPPHLSLHRDSLCM